MIILNVLCGVPLKWDGQLEARCYLVSLSLSKGLCNNKGKTAQWKFNGSQLTEIGLTKFYVVWEEASLMLEGIDVIRVYSV